MACLPISRVNVTLYVLSYLSALRLNRRRLSLLSFFDRPARSHYVVLHWRIMRLSHKQNQLLTSQSSQPSLIATGRSRKLSRRRRDVCPCVNRAIPFFIPITQRDRYVIWQSNAKRRTGMCVCVFGIFLAPHFDSSTTTTRITRYIHRAIADSD